MVATLRGPYGQTTLEPTSNPYTIGRGPDNQLVLQDTKVSSHHAEIRSQGQGYEIIDLGSSNGTFVNEQQLVPYAPRLLSNGDHIRLGDTGFLFEAGVMPSQPPIQATVYGGSGQGSNSSYAPTLAAPPSYIGNEYGAPQGAYAPPPAVPTPPPPYGAPTYGANGYGIPQAGAAPYPPAPAMPVQKRSRRGLWITLGAVLGVLLIAAIAFGVIGYQNRSTPTKTLNAFCTAIKGGDYQTAYNQLSSGLQEKFGSEAAFAAGYSTNGGLGKTTSCSVSSVNDGAGTGTINYTLSGGSSLVVDYTLVDENGWKIDAQQLISTPTETLLTYCGALKSQDYQTAYDQLSTSARAQETEAQFAANFKSVTVNDCTVSNVNDTAGTGQISYTLNSTNVGAFDYTLINENNTWKINSEKQHA